MTKYMLVWGKDFIEGPFDFSSYARNFAKSFLRGLEYNIVEVFFPE